MINGHGNNLHQYGKGKIKADFSSNIAFNNRSEEIIAFLEKRLGSIKNYPDPSTVELCKKIASHHSVSPKNVLVTNGSAEAFYVVAHYLSKIHRKSCKTMIFTPAFAEYEDSCNLFEHSVEFAPISSFCDANLSEFGSVWIGCPNNPDGYRVSRDQIEKGCNEYNDCTFVVDNAYNDLSLSEENYDQIAKNIITIHSLTKSFGIPGLRLGYVIAEQDIIDQLCSMRAPWSVNSLSVIAGEYVMDNYKELFADTALLLAQSQYLQNEIAKIHHIEVTHSDCNFFLCNIKDSTLKAVQLKEYLVDNFGILIRDASNFRGLGKGHFRVATQNRESNNKLIEALKQWSNTIL